MPDTSYEFLTDFFKNHLPFTPTAGQIDTFKADLRLVSPFLMRASLLEVKAGTQGQAVAKRATEWRPAIYQVYNRKIAEHAQLFPIFHSFETAFRSTVAVELERHYDTVRWWDNVHKALRAGQLPRTVRAIGTTPLTRDAADVIGRIIESIDGQNLQRNVVSGLNNGFEFVEQCDLGQIGFLIGKHWAVFSPLFVRGTKPLPLTEFVNKFVRVRDARNDVYHHKSVARMSQIVATAEDLLDYLDFSLGFVCGKIDDSAPAALTFAIPPASRHRTW
ncbi:MAG: hypothetical protein AB7U62_01230 [Pseudolabrys sp.]